MSFLFRYFHSYRALIYQYSYLNGKKIDYTGSKTVPAMSAWVRKAMAPGVVSVDDAEFNRRLKDEEVVFLLLHSEEDKRVVVSLYSGYRYWSLPSR